MFFPSPEPNLNIKRCIFICGIYINPNQHFSNNQTFKKWVSFSVVLLLHLQQDYLRLHSQGKCECNVSERRSISLAWIPLWTHKIYSLDGQGHSIRERSDVTRDLQGNVCRNSKDPRTPHLWACLLIGVVGVEGQVKNLCVSQWHLGHQSLRQKEGNHMIYLGERRAQCQGLARACKAAACLGVFEEVGRADISSGRGTRGKPDRVWQLAPPPSHWGMTVQPVWPHMTSWNSPASREVRKCWRLI